MDVSVPRDLPLRFNRSRQRLYAYNFNDSWWNPFRRWHVAPVEIPRASVTRDGAFFYGWELLWRQLE
ncbi:hypothetical protein CTI14_42095 [Methylobacterium radiotolerans]|nr:hypothetical protein CTI14_42095 [Methylobacterium radiotolerans]